jgi:hypothetical protein
MWHQADMFELALGKKKKKKKKKWGGIYFWIDNFIMDVKKGAQAATRPTREWDSPNCDGYIKQFHTICSLVFLLHLWQKDCFTFGENDMH